MRSKIGQRKGNESFSKDNLEDIFEDLADYGSKTEDNCVDLEISAESESEDENIPDAWEPSFLQRLCDHELLSKEKESELIVKAQAGDQAAKNKLIQCNLRLVVSIAKKYVYASPNLTLQDLVQEGSIGLMTGIQKFDVSRGFRLSTYVTWWIRQAIQRAVQDKSEIVRVPVHMQEAKQKISRSTHVLRHSLGRLPTLEEIGEHVGISKAKVESALKAKVPVVSLDYQSNPDSDSSLQDILTDTTDLNSPEAVADVSLLRKDVNKLLECLRPHERKIIALRFGFDGGKCLSLDEAGRQLGLSRERVRQLQILAMRKLRDRARKTKLQQYVS